MTAGNDGQGQDSEGHASWRQRIGSGARTAVRFLLGSSRSRGSLVSNQTNRRLKIRRPDNTALILSPLECARRVSAEEVEAFNLQSLTQRGTISLQPEPSPWLHRLALIQSLTGKLSLLSF
ncbi:MAG TPA: hypothetical protein VEU33_36895, partial [Archangium sp.]|nr:hypothetical protein [Archangium sp.]